MLESSAGLDHIVEIAAALKTQLEAIDDDDDENVKEPLQEAVQLTAAVELLLHVARTLSST